MKFLLVFVVILMTLGVNLSDNYVARVGLDSHALLAGLVALVITGLVFHRRLALIVVVIVLSVGANLPTGMAASWGINRDILTAALFGVVLVPYIASWLDL